MTTNLEDMYANMVLEDEDEDGVIMTNEELPVKEQSFVLVGRFLTEKNINFNAMQNVMASLWRLKEGMEIHDLGEHRFSFMFFHKLDLQKVVEGGPWTFEQSLLLYHVLGENENPHTVPLNNMDIWIQVYDVPKGLISEKLLQNIGNFVGSFVKSDPTNINGVWKMFMRIRVTMNVEKPIKRRMKIKREGGEWSWVNFKYERLSLFCFVCGVLGHSERDCSVVYANADKIIEKAYGTWLRAPMKGGKQQNLGAKWLRNAGGMSSMDGRKTESTTVQAQNRVWERVTVSSFGVKSMALNMKSDWGKAREVDEQHSSQQQRRVNTWCKPPEQWIKINTDAACHVNGEMTGLGYVARDDTGRFIRARSKKIQAGYQPRIAEALSLREALSWTKEWRSSKCVFETDAMTLVDAINKVKENQGRSMFDTIVDDCRELIKHFEEVLIVFVPRSANSVAHLLAKGAYSMSGLQEWVNTAPDFLFCNLDLEAI